ncbi:MAG: stage III sporulation protein AF [Ruminococcaceae bacterium]|nr:stage III sporulation protein AF [Oscillospiraceae bacterium]
MAFFQQWLLGVLACALLVSAAVQLCPEGSVKKIARFTGGLLLLLAMLRPLGEVSPELLGWDAPDYREAVAWLELELGRESERALADGIAEELGAYIEDKADSLGAEVSAEVTVTSRGGAPAPERVTLHGAYNGALAEWIAAELGITEERQIWIDGR